MMDPNYLNGIETEGVIESSGRFTLSPEDRLRKFGRSVLLEEGELTLKLVQAFVGLGCRKLQLETTNERLLFCGSEPTRALRYQNIELGQKGPEGFVALAIASLFHQSVLSVCFAHFNILGEDAEHYHLMGASPSERLAPPDDSAWLVFEIVHSEIKNLLPLAFLYKHLAYCPMRIYVNGTLLNSQGSSRKAFPFSIFWLEALWIDEENPAILLYPTVKAVTGIGWTPTSRPRWIVQDGRRSLQSMPNDRPLGSLVVLLRRDLVGPSLFWPVVSGVLLRPFSQTGFPSGMDIVFAAADSMPTDLEGRQLLWGLTLQENLKALDIQILATIQILEKEGYDKGYPPKTKNDWQLRVLDLGIEFIGSSILLLPLAAVLIFVKEKTIEPLYCESFALSMQTWQSEWQRFLLNGGYTINKHDM